MTGRTFEDALWWSLVTAFTVGYGDISPETTYGRAIAVLLMLLGISFIGVLTGTLATYFMGRVHSKTNGNSLADQQIEFIKDKLDDLEKMEEKDLHLINNMIKTIWEDKNNKKED